ncbi:ABC transporter substrate-binding protein [Fodinibius halophilus]|uniref:Amino acid ABC transporter substrate-binding protein n=1 Tax=Fodinibius halophilus TaxID=1736908 RepID=A0A6M1T7B7_9BACT|nr:ABC transporter substrate-binding protein [Fodinibius halophilus]NGP87881.1 amino acid ABC transporter substrate-binding protein [Fodinibius halophilus]
MESISKRQQFFLPLSVLLLLPLFVLLPFNAEAQSFDEGLKLYQQGKYEEAASIFTQLKTKRGYLFSGKSYFGLGKYLTAKSYLEQLSAKDNSELYLEAQYNLALTDFQLGQYGNALNRLYPFKDQQRKTQLVTDAIHFYDDILHFLTMNQRKNAFQQAENAQIKYDLVKAAFSNVDYPIAKMLYNQLVQTKIDTTIPAMQKLSKMIRDSVSYAVEKSYNSRPNTPSGMTYNIGAALPSYDNESAEFEVARNLYFGFVLAAETFNQHHTDKKAFIRFQNTAANKDTAAFAMTNFAWNVNADAVLGPLFSEPAKRMTEYAEQYQIPMLAPLANSGSLNTDNPYVFQANPTLGAHGKQMAEYAVNTLNMDTLAVIAEKNTLGVNSAYTFRDHAERLGARVSYFFVEDFASQGFDLTDYTKYFTTDTVKIDSLRYHHVDGIYAPFTGQAAPTLAELLWVDLEGMNSSIPVLGSQVWGDANIPKEQLDNREIYFSESFYLNKKSQKVEQFSERFKKRFDIEANRFSMIGYDTAEYILRTLNRVGNPALLKDALKHQPLYEGLISNISFEGTHVNQQVKIFTVSKAGVQPVLEYR